MKLKHFLTGAVSLLFLLQGLYSQTVTSPAITAGDIKYDISYLASDDLKGRYPGTPGSRAASEFIRNQFREAGLKLLGEDGFQNFEVVVNVSVGPDNSFKFNDKKAIAGSDFTPFPFSKNETVAAGVVFAGYGFEIKQDSLAWNDYEGIDVNNKWVMILRGDPEMEKQESRFVLYGEDRDKVLLARDKGAAGVLFVSGKNFDEKDELVSMYFDKTKSTAGIPVIHIKRTLADEILSADQLNVESLENLLISDMKPHSAGLSTKVEATTEVLQEKVIARNVVGLLEGSDPILKNTYIVVGAHYDHLGMGGPGSGSRFLDSLAIHNGADDNASGVAGVMELASLLALEGPPLKRSVVFVAFDCEELGLLGSRYFVTNPLINMKNVMAMINFDMIGRLKPEDQAIMIGGTGTSLESEGILNSLDTGSIKLNYSPEGFGPSDHASFYGENITVFFFTTGAHEDYHTPDDDWEKINFEGEREVLDIGRQLTLALADRQDLLTFQEAGPKQQEGGRAGYRFKVTLGIMPDFTSTVQGGLGVGGVKKDGPAFKGGMLKGDVITAIDGKQVNDIYDYMGRLKMLKPGQVISVDVLRNNQKIVLIIQL
jgi:aminopeptidase YwaD